MNKTYTNSEMVALLREEVARLGTQKELARQIGISEVFLTDILKGRAQVTAQVAEWLGYTKQTVFFKAKRHE